VGTASTGPRADLAAAEEWFRDRGLPWFVDAVDERVRDLLGRRRLWLLFGGVTLVAAVVGWLTQRTQDLPSAVLVGVLVALALLLVYAGGPLRVAVIGRWAARRVLAELDLLLPLVTRALPLLLLFMTFLFINTEVWQVASALSWPTLYAVVLVFFAVAIAFLLTRLPEEVRQVQQAAAGEGIARACRGTPLEQQAQALARERGAAPVAEDGSDAEPAANALTLTQRANLLLVLLVTQTLQVLVLALAVFGFFLGFGLLAIRSAVVQAWIGHAPTPMVWNLGFAQLHLPVSSELCHVSAFLSAFAGLYFTVYAVSDATYRAQFFGELSRGLEQAIGVREVYRHLLRTTSR
jgi:hypothetical protein